MTENHIQFFNILSSKEQLIKCIRNIKIIDVKLFSSDIHSEKIKKNIKKYNQIHASEILFQSEQSLDFMQALTNQISQSKNASFVLGPLPLEKLKDWNEKLGTIETENTIYFLTPLNEAPIKNIILSESIPTNLFFKLKPEISILSANFSTQTTPTSSLIVCTYQEFKTIHEQTRDSNQVIGYLIKSKKP